MTLHGIPHSFSQVTTSSGGRRVNVFTETDASNQPDVRISYVREVPVLELGGKLQLQRCPASVD